MEVDDDDDDDDDDDNDEYCLKQFDSIVTYNHSALQRHASIAM